MQSDVVLPYKPTGTDMCMLEVQKVPGREDLSGNRCYLELLGNGDNSLLVLVSHGDEDIARGWQLLTGSQGSLGVCLTKVRVNSHHLARGPHLRSQQRVST